MDLEISRMTELGPDSYSFSIFHNLEANFSTVVVSVFISLQGMLRMFDSFRFLKKNRFFWSKNRCFESILCCSIFIRTDALPSESEPEWPRHSAIRKFETDDFFFRNPVFHKNRMKMFLEIISNFSNNF